jgi:hypothetical protein
MSQVALPETTFGEGLDSSALLERVYRALRTLLLQHDLLYPHGEPHDHCRAPRFISVVNARHKVPECEWFWLGMHAHDMSMAGETLRAMGSSPASHRQYDLDSGKIQHAPCLHRLRAEFRQVLLLRITTGADVRSASLGRLLMSQRINRIQSPLSVQVCNQTARRPQRRTQKRSR